VTDASRTLSHRVTVFDSNFRIKCLLHSHPLFQLQPLPNVNFPPALTMTMNQPSRPNSLPLLKRAQDDQHVLLDRISLLRILAVLVDWASGHRLLPNRALLHCPALHPLPLRRAQLARQVRRLNQRLLAMFPSQWLSHVPQVYERHPVRKGQLSMASVHMISASRCHNGAKWSQL